MNSEIVYVCNSTNNKNVRANELNILRKFSDKLYFEFGETENNIKKRFYDDVETLEKDFAKLEKIKNREKKEVEEKKEEKSVSVEVLESIHKPKNEMFKKTKNRKEKKNIF